MEITEVITFICEECCEETEFKGTHHKTARKLCPHCCCDEVVEYVNCQNVGENKNGK